MDLIERAVTHFGSGRKVADFLQVSDAKISMIRKGERHLRPIEAARLAEAIGERWIDHVLPILAGHEPLPEDKAYWLGKAGRLAQTGALVAVAVLAGIVKTGWTHCILC